MKQVGVLALQGGFAAHARMLERLNLPVREVRNVEELKECEGGLVLPGGESSTQLKLMKRFAFFEGLKAYHAAGHPILTTCAGTILVSRSVDGFQQECFGWVDIAVARNAWGRQVHSFEAKAQASEPNLAASIGGEFPLVFIRAPRIVKVGINADVMMSYADEPVFVRQANVFSLTFHPELTDNAALHAYVFGVSDALRA